MTDDFANPEPVNWGAVRISPDALVIGKNFEEITLRIEGSPVSFVRYDIYEAALRKIKDLEAETAGAGVSHETSA